MTRLFLTSYQKSGTHQIMPALGIHPHIVDRSGNSLSMISKYIDHEIPVGQDGIEITCKSLRTFENRAFGHVSYLKEYVEAIQTTPTKVIFNVRDPRDVIVAEYHNLYKKMPEQRGWPDFILKEGMYLSDSDDPISHLIDFAIRWERWLGWMDEEFVYTVRFEDLRTKGMETCTSLISWIRSFGIVISDPHNIYKRLAPTRDNPTFRKGLIGEWKDVFSDEHKKKAERVLGHIITRLGYEI